MFFSISQMKYPNIGKRFDLYIPNLNPPIKSSPKHHLRVTPFHGYRAILNLWLIAHKLNEMNEEKEDFHCTVSSNLHITF
jgi:hypothetical protein